MNSLIGMLAGDFMGAVSTVNGTSIGVANVTNPFAFVDGTMSKFMNGATLAKMLGLLFASPLGFMYVIIMIIGLVFYLFAVLKAAVLYILAMLTISLLLVVAPIFMTFMLFERTKEYFVNWLKSLINYLFQPVLVFTALAIFNVFVYSALYTLLHYSVCWKDVFTIPMGIFGDIPLFRFYLPESGHDGSPLLASGMPIGLFMILIFIIITDAMLKFIDFMAELAAHLTIGAKGTSLAGAAAMATQSGLNILKSGAGKAIGAARTGAGKAGSAAIKAASKDSDKKDSDTTSRK